MKSVAFFLTMFVAGANAFVIVVPQSQPRILAASPADEIDFDAPVERAAAVGNVVEAEKVKVMGVEMPAFISRAFNMRSGGGSAAPMELDEECYLGKDGDAEDCVDFDPMHTP